MNFHRNSCKQTEQKFFWHVLSPDSAQFERGTGMLEVFSRFVTVGLGMFARFCMLFSNLHGTTLFAFWHVLYFNQI